MGPRFATTDTIFSAEGHSYIVQDRNQHKAPDRGECHNHPPPQLQPQVAATMSQPPLHCKERAISIKHRTGLGMGTEHDSCPLYDLLYARNVPFYGCFRALLRQCIPQCFCPRFCVRVSERTPPPFCYAVTATLMLNVLFYGMFPHTVQQCFLRVCIAGVSVFLHPKLVVALVDIAII